MGSDPANSSFWPTSSPGGGGRRCGARSRQSMVVVTMASGLSASRAAHAARDALSASAWWMPWVIALLSLIAVVALLTLWQRDLMLELGDRILAILAEFLPPLRNPHQTLHDPKYLRRILEAEAISRRQARGDSSDAPPDSRLDGWPRGPRRGFLAWLEALQRPMPNRHRVIHDRKYLRDLLDAEDESQASGDARPYGELRDGNASPSSRRGQRASRRSRRRR